MTDGMQVKGWGEFQGLGKLEGCGETGEEVKKLRVRVGVVGLLLLGL
jgi:hypothetical protein